MAENNNEELDQQIPEKNDMLLFAEDLVEFMMSPVCRKNLLEYGPTEFCNHSYNMYVPVIRRAIDFIRYYLADDHENLFNKMEINLFNSNSFERLDEIIVAKCFTGSLEANFLLYCVNISNMAEYFYIQGIRDAPDLAKRYIYRFLQEHVSAEVWDDICRISEAIVKMLRDSLNELDIRSVSDDIEHQEQEQEEVSSESSFSLCEEASDSSRRSGSNTTLKFTYEKIKGYLKLYAHAYLKCGCKIGLCSLREQESPPGDKPPTDLFERNKGINGLKSDDKPRPGASYIVYELFYIISNLKTKTNELYKEIELVDKSASD